MTPTAVRIFLLFGLPAAFLGCDTNRPKGTGPAPSRTESAPETDRYREEREAMVRETIERRGVSDPAVLAAMRKVERHRFVPDEWLAGAYADHPLPIGHEQTISQPYIVAFMTEAVRPRPGQTVLEVGTGSGYQAAVLAEIVDHVYSIEILEPLAHSAKRRLEALGYANVTVRAGDGYRGWPEHAPFDAILVTAAPDHVPKPLVDQLKVGGRMVLPVGGEYETQDLLLLEKTESGTLRRSLLPVRFVPMTGEAEEK